MLHVVTLQVSIHNTRPMLVPYYSVPYSLEPCSAPILFNNVLPFPETHSWYYMAMRCPTTNQPLFSYISTFVVILNAFMGNALAFLPCD